MKRLKLETGMCYTCKFYSSWYENHGMGLLEPMSDCDYDGDDIDAFDELLNTGKLGTEEMPCEKWMPVTPQVCEKHQCEYIGVCQECEDELAKEMSEAYDCH